MKKILSFLLLGCLLSIGNMWAEDIVWDFSDLSSQSFTNGNSYSFLATDGVTEMRYSAGSSDNITAKNGDNSGYLRENGKTGNGTVKDIDNTTNVGKTRLIRLFVNGKGKLQINCNATKGAYKVLDGSASGETLISSLSADTQSEEIEVLSDLIWIETTTKGYITSIVWTPSAPAGPTIITQPEGASYVTGATISELTVAASASAGNLNYQWYSCDDAEKANAAAIDGATNDSYTPSAAGFYYVVVTDDNGFVESDVVQIEISAAALPVFTTDLEAAVNVTAGVEQEFAVEASGNPDPTYQWYMDGVAIDGATSATYSYMAEVAGSVALHCVATNSQGSVNSTICTVTATLPDVPTITDDLSSSANAFVGVSYKLGITAEGIGTLSYQWYMDGALIAGATQSTYVYIPEQEGNHAIFCVVSNAGGDTFSEQCTVSASTPSVLEDSFISDIPSDFVLPSWMAASSVTNQNYPSGLNFNGAYSGGDAGVAGEDVLRLEKFDTIYMHIQGPGVLEFNVSATGTRTVRIDANGVEIANSGSFSKNNLKKVKGLLPAGNNVVKFYQVGSNGGLTIASISFVQSKLAAADTDFYGLYYEHEVAIPSGIEAFYGVLNAQEDELALTKIEGVIPAETAVLVKATAAGDYYFAPSATEAAAIAENSLKGVAEATTVESIENDNAGKQVLTLGIANDVVAFRQPAATSIAANKVYLLVSAAATAPVRVVFAENSATAIDNIEGTDEAVKFVENGVLYIRRNGVVYTTTGQVVR